MDRLSDLVIRYRVFILLAWACVAIVGGLGAPTATAALTYDFSLPGTPGYRANHEILRLHGNGADHPPVLLVSEDRAGLAPADGELAERLVLEALPGARVTSWAGSPELLSRDDRVGVTLVHPPVTPGTSDSADALPPLEGVARQIERVTGSATRVTGADPLSTGGTSGGADVLAETLAGGIGALVVLVVIFGSLLAVTPLVVAAASILTTFLLVLGLTTVTDVSAVVQFLLALIGLGVAIDYALLIVTRWREELGNGADPHAAVRMALRTAGRSVFFSGLTVAISLTALIALPVPFLRSVGYAGLLIPIVSVAAALTLLPALLLVFGRRLDWPHRRTTSPDSRLWRTLGTWVIKHRWLSIAGSAALLLSLAVPLLSIHLGDPTNASLASAGGPAAGAMIQVERAGLGDGLTRPIEILTDLGDRDAVLDRLRDVPGVAGAVAPYDWTKGGLATIDVWTRPDVSSPAGSDAVQSIRQSLTGVDARIGGAPVQTADFISAVYGNAWWIGLLIAVVTTLFLARALRSLVLPVKALLLNVLSVSAAYGATVLIWQYGFGTEMLFGQRSSDAITVWIPVAVFAFLFGLSMDYEVFLLSRISEEHHSGLSTDESTIRGMARTGRLISSGALILFFAFVALSRAPVTDIRILATALALGIMIDATIVRGVLAPALVAAMGRANWWYPTRGADPEGSVRVLQKAERPSGTEGTIHE